MNSIDFTDDNEVTIVLLSSAADWRSRTVDQLSFTSARNCKSKRSIQISDLRQFLEITEVAKSESFRNATKAMVILSMGVIPNRPLLGFDVNVDGKPAYLLKRVAIAAIEAEFVRSLVKTIHWDPKQVSVLESICEYVPGRWIQVRERAISGRLFRSLSRRSTSVGTGDPDTSGISERLRFYLISWRMCEYLRDSLPDSVLGKNKIDRKTVKRWLSLSLPASELLNDVLQEPFDIDSSADNFLLCIPILAERGELSNVDQIESTVKRFVELCGSLHESDEGIAALVDLAEYGRRWEVLVEVEVPLDRPFLAAVCEARPMNIGRWGTTSQDVIFRESGSSHVVFSVDDDAVGIAKFKALGAMGGPVPTFFTAARKTREAIALYSSEDDRDYLIRFRIRLKLLLGIRFVGFLIELIVLAALVVLMANKLRNAPLYATQLAVLITPTTFAASVLLTRARTTIGVWLTRWNRYRIGLWMIGLWGFSAYLFLNHQVLAG